MPRERISARQRRAIAERAQGCCEYCMCQADFATYSFSIEHIIPIHSGGSNTLSNLALACQGCNSHKHIRVEYPDPFDDTPVALYHPRRQKWHEHFQWSADFTYVIGITPTGRATVDALKMNRSSVVNLRRVLFQAGEHPPDLTYQ